MKKVLLTSLLIVSVILTSPMAASARGYSHHSTYHRTYRHTTRRYSAPKTHHTKAVRATHAVLSSNYEMICRVTSVECQNNIYNTTVVNEDGEAFILKADRDLTGEWLNVFANNQGTTDVKDDTIYGFNVLEY